MKKSANDARSMRPWRLLAASVMGLCALMLSGVTHPALAVPISITYADDAGEGFNDPELGAARKKAFEAAADIWSQTLQGTVLVEINATFDPIGGDPQGAVLGFAGPASLVKDFQGNPAPVPGTAYASALGNQLAATDLAPNTPDIFATFNSDVDDSFVLGDIDFYYGLDGNAGNDVDFLSVCLHEFCHGLGFTKSVIRDGSFLSDTPQIYDRFLVSGAASGSPRLVDLTQLERASALISGKLYFDGPKTNVAAGGDPAKIYAPDPFRQGSSTAHLDEDLYSETINELMTPISSGVAHEPGPIVTGIMRDLGWAFTGIDQPTPTPAPTEGPTPDVTPTPAPTTAPVPTSAPRTPPRNDNFVNAQELRTPTGNVTGSNIFATKEQGEPIHVNTGGTSVWYRWTAPARGNVTFSTSGSTDQNRSRLDTLLAAYLGRSVDRLTRVAANDDVVTGNVTSRLTFVTVPGRTYYIAVDGFFGAMGRVILRWQFAAAAPPPPRNDNFERAQPISGSQGRYASDSRSATLQSGEPLHAGVRGGRSVWFNWTAPASGRVVFTTAGSTSDPEFVGGGAFDTTLAVYSGNTLTRLVSVASNNDTSASNRTSRVVFEATARQSYKIAVDGIRGAGGIVYLTWSMNEQAPANDLFRNAELITGSTGRAVGNNLNATKETSEPDHAGNPGGQSVWYRWTAPVSGQTGFSTARSGLLTSLDVYTGSRLNNLTPVEGSARNGTRPTHTVIFEAVAGTTYYIAVDGFFNAANGSTAVGSFLLRWSTRLPPTETPQSPPAALQYEIKRSAVASKSR